MLYYCVYIWLSVHHLEMKTMTVFQEQHLYESYLTPN